MVTLKKKIFMKNFEKEDVCQLKRTVHFCGGILEDITSFINPTPFNFSVKLVIFISHILKQAEPVTDNK